MQLTPRKGAIGAIVALLFLIVPYLFAGSTALVWGVPLWFVVCVGAAAFLAVFTAAVIHRRWNLANRTLGERDED